MTKTEKEKVADWKQKLASHPQWAIRGCLAIYAKQTADEREAEQTREDNGVGFTGTDAEILSSFAKQIQRWEQDKRFPSPLSDKQLAILHKRMPKYAGQLLRIVNGEV
jgi:DNA-binding transcriptional regulator YiaG